MNDLLSWRLEDVPPEQAVLVLAVAAIAGALYCFLGYRLLKFILGLTGFLLAGCAAAFVVGLLSYGSVWAMGIGMLIGGICGAMALFFLYRTGIFCVGMLGAALVAYSILQGRPEPWILWAVAGLGFAGGFLALLIERPMMTLATAAIGAMMMTQAGLAVALEQGWVEALSERSADSVEGLPDFPFLTYGVLGVWLVLTMAGTLFQLRIGRKRRSA